MRVFRPLNRSAAVVLAALLVASAAPAAPSPQQASPLPTGDLTFGGFEASLAVDGAFHIEGSGWPIRALLSYDPERGEELWSLGGSSKITAPIGRR